MTTARTQDYPAVRIGALGKPAPWSWASNEPAQGVFRWGILDASVADASDHGIDYLFDIGETPSCAARDPSSCTTKTQFTMCTSPPTNIQDWNDYLTTIAARYKGRIRYYEVWNEPNTSQFWSGNYADMVQLARSAYGIIKSIDPDAHVLTPAPTGSVHPVPAGSGFSASATDWMAAYLKAGGDQLADVGAWHGYIGNGDATIFPMPEQEATTGCRPSSCFGSIASRAQLMRTTFDASAMAGKPRFDTEGSWGITTNLDAATNPAGLPAGTCYRRAASQLTICSVFTGLPGAVPSLASRGAPSRTAAALQTPQA
jgi:hypothetical protein